MQDWVLVPAPRGDRQGSAGCGTMTESHSGAYRTSVQAGQRRIALQDTHVPQGQHSRALCGSSIMMAAHQATDASRPGAVDASGFAQITDSWQHLNTAAHQCHAYPHAPCQAYVKRVYQGCLPACSSAPHDHCHLRPPQELALAEGHSPLVAPANSFCITCWS